MTTNEDLLKLAREATPGPWELRKAISVNAGSADEVAGGEVWATGRGWTITDWCQRPDAAYIAAAHPARIIYLIEEVERLTRERDANAAKAADWQAMRDERDNMIGGYENLYRDTEGDIAMANPRAQAAEARATRAEAEIARRDAVAKASWGDQKDQHTDAILAAHPTYTKDFDTYEAALAMVGTRHGKYELVNLVNWLLARATRAEGLLAEAGEVLGSATVELDAVVQAMADGAATGLNAAGLHRLRQRVIARLRAARAFLAKLKEQG